MEPFLSPGWKCSKLHYPAGISSLLALTVCELWWAHSQEYWCILPHQIFLQPSEESPHFFYWWIPHRDPPTSMSYSWLDAIFLKCFPCHPSHVHSTITPMEKKPWLITRDHCWVDQSWWALANSRRAILWQAVRSSFSLDLQPFSPASVAYYGTNRPTTWRLYAFINTLQPYARVLSVSQKVRAIFIPNDKHVNKSKTT